MIRFCDGDVGCLEYSLLSRSKLMSYFRGGHLNDMICVYDSSGTYIGIITYYSLLHSTSIDAAIYKEYVILDDDVWKNARKIFWTKSRNFREITLLPVLDRNYQLICFAYQDEEANREVRMLRELQETEGALRFADVFPNCKCVKIYEFNELAFLFAEYLKNQEIEVQVTGVLWQNFFDDEECQTPEYECMHIYAEGTWEKTCSIKEDMLRSVSVEFECIDEIYETNIKNNIITNAEGEYNELFKRLRGEKEVILCGTGNAVQEAYDFLLRNGIEPSCFVVYGWDASHRHRMFGKRILGLNEAICMYQNPVFIDCEAKDSAWGFGKADNYDYIGYRRNKNFFLLRDYVDIPDNGLESALSNWKIVLTGDLHLCKYLAAHLISKNISVIGYLDIPTQDIKWDGMNIGAADVDQDVMCLVAAPNFYAMNSVNIHEPFELKNCLIEYLEKVNIDNYSDYFSYMISYMNIEENKRDKYPNKQLMPKRVVVGSIEIVNGTMFFRSLLDGHPNILLMPRAFSFKDKLFWTCIRLSMVNAKDILSLFWRICEEADYGWCFNPVKFNEKMEELLACSDRFTSQEIFVMIFISYMHMYGRNIDITESIVYWDPHFLGAKDKEECVKWLGTEQVHCDIINVVRNACMSRGSHVKGFISLAWTGAGLVALRDAYEAGVYGFLDVEKKIYEQSDRLIVQFEELKCSPEETLMKICTEWGIPWSESLMHTTRYGEKAAFDNGEKMVSDFDLSPVYNTYEKYFSEFDRLRIMIIQALWQRKFGYPYERLKQFSRRDIQEMFLKRFRFEDLTESDGKEFDWFFKVKLLDAIRTQLQKIRMVETLEETKVKLGKD